MSDARRVAQWTGALVAALATVAGCVSAQDLAEDVGDAEHVLFGFEAAEKRSGAWKSLPGGNWLSPSCGVSRKIALAGARSLSVPCKLPGGSPGAFVALEGEGRNWYPFSRLSLSIQLPDDAPEGLRAAVHVKDAEYHFFRHLSPATLRPGQWHKVAVDLTGRSSAWQGLNHQKAWDGYSRRGLRELGVTLAADVKFSTRFHVDHITLSRDPDAVPADNAIHALRVNDTEVARYGKFEVSFNLARTYENPFDPDQVDVRGHFASPGGRTITVPGFFYQGYVRRQERGAEALGAMGASHWKVRFSPGETGAYKYYIEVHDGETIRSETGGFRCVEGKRPGFVRISDADRYCFEHSDGAFYYPIGHNVASVGDSRASAIGANLPAKEGTYAYDRILERMAANGENFTRLWMAPWSFGIEWTDSYRPQFRGLGRYNQANAWRLDHVLRCAEERGIYCMLVLTSHGEVGDHESDFFGAKGSPYWSGNGGPIDHPREFYTCEDVFKHYSRKARYIVARWGYSPAVMAWEILSEPDLASFYSEGDFGRVAAGFVQRVARHVRDLDPADHMVTSCCYRYLEPAAGPMLGLPELDFNTGHLFSGKPEMRLPADYAEMRTRHGKAFFLTEAGLTPFAFQADRAALGIHRVLWASHMAPYAGAAAPWWWGLIDRLDLYGHFRALSNFAAGEDRRGKGYQAARAEAQSLGKRRKLDAALLTNGRESFCWVYEPASFGSQLAWDRARAAPAEVRIPGQQPGPYLVEVWHTIEGRPVATVDTQAGEDGVLCFVLPEFARDVALKAKPLPARAKH